MAKKQKHQQIKEGDIVRVVWTDSCGTEGWHYGATKAKVINPVTIGWVIDASKDCLMLAATIVRGAVKGCCSPISIPWVAIKDLQILPKKWGKE